MPNRKFQEHLQSVMVFFVQNNENHFTKVAIEKKIGLTGVKLVVHLNMEAQTDDYVLFKPSFDN